MLEDPGEHVQGGLALGQGPAGGAVLAHVLEQALQLLAVFPQPLLGLGLGQGLGALVQLELRAPLDFAQGPGHAGVFLAGAGQADGLVLGDALHLVGAGGVLAEEKEGGGQGQREPDEQVEAVHRRIPRWSPGTRKVPWKIYPAGTGLSIPAG
ncbi:MAG TPA: hypothetical protein DD766_00725 [Desulfovibrio sp.]|nr:hypothetical protein [Desulfovibrio sp.]